MRNLGQVVGISLLLVSAPLSAFAADMPVKAPYTKAPPVVAAYDWSGFYIGLNGGGGSARECWSVTSDFGIPINPPFAAGCHNATGGTAGGQVGYRWQTASWVFGLEAQGNWANFNASSRDLFFNSVTIVPVGDETTVRAFGLFTGQVGYAINNVLFYAKGGAAVTNNKYNTTSFIPQIFVTQLFTAGQPFSEATETRWGGVVGVGAEWGFAPNWSIAAEYDHLFMGTNSVSLFTVAPFPPAGILFSGNNIRQDVDIGTIRVNYRFGGPVVARY